MNLNIKPILNSFYLIFLLNIFCGCSQKTTPPSTEIYIPLQAEGESGLKFTRLSEDDDNVVGPFVYKNENVEIWQGSRFLDVSKDGKILAYCARRDDDNYNIWTRSTSRSGGKTQITSEGTACVSPCFSYDGKTIAYADIVEDTYNIYTKSINGSGPRTTIAETTASELDPCFTQGDGMILFSTSNGPDDYMISSYSTKTSLKAIYSKGSSPVQIPGTTSILVTRIRRDKDKVKSEICKIDLKTMEQSVIISDEKQAFSSPDVSKEGKIVCVGTTPKAKRVPANLDLYVFDLNGENKKKLTTHAGNDVSPRWSPDGKSIYFIGQREVEKKNLKYNIYKINYN